MRGKLLITLVAAVLALGGCESMNLTETQRGTAVGAGVGAAAGAVIGATTKDGGGKRAATGAVIGGVAGGVIGNIWSSRMEEQRRRMEQATRGTGVDVSRTDDNRLKLNIPTDISFDSNRADIKSNFRPILDNFAASLNDHQATNVTIVGHADSTGNDSINDPLSRNRAASTRDYLASRGVSSNRFNVDGRGSREPIASNATESGKARNRRVEIYVTEPGGQGPRY